MTNNTIAQQRFANVVIAARAGDAMGTPTEGLSVEEIEARFGWVSTFEGDGTDDSLMASVLSETIIRTQGWPDADSWAVDIVRHRQDIREKRDSFFVSLLQTAQKLGAGYRPAEAAIGNMPSSSSAMCIWPIGLLLAGRPHEAAVEAYELARLIHVGEADHCTDAAAAVAAAVSAAFLPGASIRSSLDVAVATLRTASGELFRSTLLRAVDLADASEDYVSFRDGFNRQFQRPIMCDALETVPAAFALAILADGDARTAVEYGANFGRDADTIACMAGAMCGALEEPLPDVWIESLGVDSVRSAGDTATALLGAARQRAETQRARLSVGLGIIAAIE
ncbi:MULTISPECIES: ADP-ribosylglycohydrolase family protein [unclassified Microbacterium]|uniref:ADP-ribosylglycohydrolase family protein n=1 Tax=unclassified Microbacterium TaxID=2609290 RepID=UPI00364FA806